MEQKQQQKGQQQGNQQGFQRGQKRKICTETKSSTKKRRHRSCASKNPTLTSLLKSKDWIGQSGLKKIMDARVLLIGEIRLLPNSFVINTFHNQNFVGQIIYNQFEKIYQVVEIGRYDSNDGIVSLFPKEHHKIMSGKSPFKTWTETIYTSLSSTLITKSGRNSSSGLAFIKPIIMLQNDGQNDGQNDIQKYNCLIVDKTIADIKTDLARKMLEQQSLSQLSNHITELYSQPPPPAVPAQSFSDNGWISYEVPVGSDEDEEDDDSSYSDDD